MLGLQPTAAIGLSSGETNSLMAFGVWRDLQPMLAEIVDSRMYGRQITGECRIAGEAWGEGSPPSGSAGGSAHRASRSTRRSQQNLAPT